MISGRTFLSKEKIRSAVKQYYDLQKLRVASGNRLVANFYTDKEKINEAVEERVRNGDIDVDLAEKQKEEGEKRLALILKDYDSLTKALNERGGTIKKMLKEIHGEIIKSEEDYNIVSAFRGMLALENQHLKIVETAVKDHPLWDVFLKDVRGCGTLMSAVVISELDPYKARHCSSFWKYAGLDVVLRHGEEGKTVLFISQGSPNSRIYIGEEPIPSEGLYIYEETGLPIPFDAPITGEGRSKKAHHLVDRTYTDHNGNIKETRGITYNAFLKSKLCGVLGTSFLRSGGKYRDIYDNYKNRLQNSVKHEKKTLKHRHNMAIRYAVKMFLRDCWVAWRTLEGLEVTDPYEVAILGHKPHGSDPSVEAVLKIIID